MTATPTDAIYRDVKFRAYWPFWLTIALIILLQGIAAWFGLFPSY